MKIRLSKAISWVGPEKKGVSKIFFLTFLTSDKHSMAKKSDRTHHSFSDPTLKRPSKDPIRSLREHKIGEHKSKVFQRSSRGIQDSREYVPLTIGIEAKPWCAYPPCYYTGSNNTEIYYWLYNF